MDTCQDQQSLSDALANHRGGLGFGPNSGLILFQSCASADLNQSIILFSQVIKESVRPKQASRGPLWQGAQHGENAKGDVEEFVALDVHGRLSSSNIPAHPKVQRNHLTMCGAGRGVMVRILRGRLPSRNYPRQSDL